MNSTKAKFPCTTKQGQTRSAPDALRLVMVGTSLSYFPGVAPLQCYINIRKFSKERRFYNFRIRFLMRHQLFWRFCHTHHLSWAQGDSQQSTNKWDQTKLLWRFHYKSTLWFIKIQTKQTCTISNMQSIHQLHLPVILGDCFPLQGKILCF